MLLMMIIQLENADGSLMTISAIVKMFFIIVANGIAESCPMSRKSLLHYFRGSISLALSRGL